MVRAASSTSPARALAQDTAQAATNPAVQVREHVPMTMPKESKPSMQRSSQTQDNPLHAVPVGAARFRPDGVFQLVEAFLPRQSKIPAKRVAQEVESLRPRVHDLRLGRMQRQAVFLDPRLHLRQG